MHDYGSDAVDLKCAVDETITTDYKAEHEYANHLISVCADGASVNMGIYMAQSLKSKKQGHGH